MTVLWVYCKRIPLIQSRNSSYTVVVCFFCWVQDKQTFLHRSGRAGRFGGEGFCVCISSEDEKASFEYLASSFKVRLHYSLENLIQIQQQHQVKSDSLSTHDGDRLESDEERRFSLYEGRRHSKESSVCVTGPPPEKHGVFTAAVRSVSSGDVPPADRGGSQHPGVSVQDAISHDEETFQDNGERESLHRSTKQKEAGEAQEQSQRPKTKKNSPVTEEEDCRGENKKLKKTREVDQGKSAVSEEPCESAGRDEEGEEEGEVGPGEGVLSGGKRNSRKEDDGRGVNKEREEKTREGENKGEETGDAVEAERKDTNNLKKNARFVFEDVSVVKIPLVGLYISHAEMITSDCPAGLHNRSRLLRRGPRDVVKGDQPMARGGRCLPSVSSGCPLVSAPEVSSCSLQCEGGSTRGRELPYALFASPFSFLELGILQTVCRERGRSTGSEAERETKTEDEPMRRAPPGQGGERRDSEGGRHYLPPCSASSSQPKDTTLYREHSPCFSLRVGVRTSSWPLSPSSFLAQSCNSSNVHLRRDEASSLSSSTTFATGPPRTHLPHPPSVVIVTRESTPLRLSPSLSTVESQRLGPEFDTVEETRVKRGGWGEEQEEEDFSSLSFLLLSFSAGGGGLGGCTEKAAVEEDWGARRRPIVTSSRSLEGLFKKGVRRGSGRSLWRRRFSEDQGAIGNEEAASVMKDAEDREHVAVFAYSRKYESVVRDGLKHIDCTWLADAAQQQGSYPLARPVVEKVKDAVTEKALGECVASNQSRLLAREGLLPLTRSRGEETSSEGAAAQMNGRRDTREVGVSSRAKSSSCKEERGTLSGEMRGKREEKREDSAGRRRSRRETKDARIDAHALWCMFEAACVVRGREEERKKREEGGGARQTEQKQREKAREGTPPAHHTEDSWGTDEQDVEEEEEEKGRGSLETGAEEEVGEGRDWLSASAPPAQCQSGGRERLTGGRGDEKNSSSPLPPAGHTGGEAYRALVQLKALHEQLWRSRCLQLRQKDLCHVG